jgi:hypothetical protein
MQKLPQTVDDTATYGVPLTDIEISHTYLDVCEQGRLYETLTEPGEDRQWVKQRFLVDVLCGDGTYPSPVRERFEVRYPRETEVLKALKSKEPCRSAWILQQLESTIFISRICSRIMAERPDVPVFTTHDCLSTVPGHISYVEAVAKDEFARLNLFPTFDREIYK